MATETLYFSVPGAAVGLTVPAGSGEISRFPSMVPSAVERLTSRYRKPRIEALLSAAVEELQEIEQALEAVYFETTLDLATGASLDILGRRVGEARESRTDAAYRDGIRTAIQVHRSEGRLLDLRGVVQSVFPSSAIWIVERYPAAVSLVVRSPGAVPFRRWASYLLRAAPAGVHVEATYGPGGVTSAQPGLYSSAYKVRSASVSPSPSATPITVVSTT